MASTVSFSAWDIVINRVGDKLFLDKRDGGPLDFPSVNENAIEPPPEAGDKAGSINSATMLAAESRDIVRKYIKQITSKATIDLEHANPFNEDSNESDADKSVDDNAYRYRVFDLTARSEGSDDEGEASADASAERCFMAVRTEIDGFTMSGNQRQKQLFIRALTQHDINATGAGDALDWRSKLDTQRAAVIAIENKNNSSKIARWAFQALLAAADQMRIGFVSRATPRDRTRHGILGFQSYTPSDLLAQHKLSEFKGWGIIKAIVDMCLQLDEGRYVIMRDPNRSVICLYSVPPGTFDNDDNEDASTAAPAADDASEMSDDAQKSTAAQADTADRKIKETMASDMAALVDAQLNIKDDSEAGGHGLETNETKDEQSKETVSGGISANATSMLRVLLPSLTKLDELLESVWAKQDTLNEVLNRLATELEQFDELIVPPGMADASSSSSQNLASAVISSGGGLHVSNDKSVVLLNASKEAAQKLRDSRTRIANINVTLKKVRTRLDNVSLLAQAKMLQNQQELQKHQHTS
ncbi:hypothetical protein GGI22_005934 [Coemansia erecta]|nr:hypothetical protein GGI22_005934 [Coemansia erecta]